MNKALELDYTGAKVITQMVFSHQITTYRISRPSNFKGRDISIWLKMSRPATVADVHAIL
jgi:hypothetical protein